MQLISTIDPIYFPDPDQTTVMRMGLAPLPDEEWMLVDSDLPQFYRHKLEQEALHKQRVYQALPQSSAAQQEFGRLLQLHLLRYHDYVLSDDGEKLLHHEFGLEWDGAASDLWHSSLWIEEDICILEQIDDDYCLTAASVCSPSNWIMEEKIGRSVDVIHDPVTGYHREMGAKVNRLLHGLKAHKPIQRLNWSIQPCGDMFWRADLKDYSGSEDKYWRVERQTLLRMPETGAIIFGIRVFMHSFAVMSRYPDFQRHIGGILDRLPQEQKLYKNLL